MGKMNSYYIKGIFLKKGEIHLKYRIEEMQAFSIVGLKTRVTKKDSFEIIPKLWDEAMQNGICEKLFKSVNQTAVLPGILGVCADGNYGNAEEFDYYIAITSHSSVPEGLEQLEVNASKWAVFEANGPLPEAIQTAWKLYEEELLTSDYTHADLPDIECYFPQGKQELWIPIVKE